MGCSPSKGKLFSKPEQPGPQNVLPTEAPQEGIDPQNVEKKSKCLKTDEKESELLITEKNPVKETAWSQLAAQNSEDIKETLVNVRVQEIVDEVKIKKTERRKKKKGKRGPTEKQKSPIFGAKLDFPPHMVRAHQAAYDFVNPNISKYEILLGLLDQAAQTQLSLQPMMSAFLLRFEEINQGLEEIAEEGEQMLKEYGDCMALPSGMIGPAAIQTKPSTATARPHDPPSDLLQQLLQHSTEKMRLVGRSVQALSDTTLEDAVEYFSSLAKLLVEKQQAKKGVEQRLARVLARIEVAAIRKSYPEDSALHSEDSGIGGENESLPGSEKHRHRWSVGSGSCGSGINVGGTFDILHMNSSNLLGQNEDDEEDEASGDDDEYEDVEDDRPERGRSNSSPPDPSQPLLCMNANFLKDQQSVNRPLTAVTTAKPEHLSSTVFVKIKMELRNSQRDLDQQMKKMSEIRGYKKKAGPHDNFYAAVLRRHSSSGLAGIQKGFFRESLSPCSLPILAPQPPKCPSVRRLINTFSHGVDGRPGQSLANIPPHIKRPRKSANLLLYDAENSNSNHNNCLDTRDNLDVDSLPPPPPEVLMDNSFQSTEDVHGNKGRSQKGSVRSLPVIIQNTGVSQRLKASMQNMEVLPTRVSVRPRSITILPVHPVRQDAVMGAQDAVQQPDTDLDSEMEKAICPYQQAHTIIHLSNAEDFPDKQNIAEICSKEPPSLHDKMGQRCENVKFYEISSCCPPVTAPPVSRARLPPSCPSVCRRFPSPPLFRPQTSSRPSSRPGSPRTVTRATDINTEVIIPSVSFSDARSVFCLKESQNSLTSTSSGCSVLPRPWGEASRGRLPMRRIDNSTRRTQSEQRPCLSGNSEFSKNVCSTYSQVKGSNSFNTEYRPVSPLGTEEDTQLDPSATVTTA